MPLRILYMLHVSMQLLTIENSYILELVELE